MKATFFASIAALGLLTPQAYAQAAQGYELQELWTVEGLVFAESVLAIPGDEFLYVSVINGDDNVGHIARLTKDGAIDTQEWVPGIQTPTGMTFHDGYIYAVNQSEVLKINKDTGQVVQSFLADADAGLNDIDVSADGRFVITAPLASKLYTIEGDAVVEWMQLTTFSFPNGLHMDGDSVIVGSMGKNMSPDVTPDEYGAMYRINLDTQDVTTVTGTEKTGTWDGVAPFADGLIGASPMTDGLWYFYEGRRSFIGNLPGGVADVGTDPEAGVIYAPYLFGNKVSAYKLVPYEWTRVSTESYFKQQVMDQYFGDESGKSIAKSDGTIEGKFGDRVLSGTYEFDDGLFCRDTMLGELDLGADCIVLEVTDSQMRLNLKEGRGLSVIYDRK